MFQLSLRSRILGTIVIGIALSIGIYRYYSIRITPLQGQEIVLTVSEDEEARTEEQEPVVLKQVTVHVVGAVENPGVYTLEEGQRVNDAVQLAVPSAKADLSLINLAEPLQDGSQIYVPSKGEKVAVTVSVPSSSAGVQGKININRASAAELESLNGIGPALAQRIIEYREKNGPFKTIEELTNVKGIGPTLLEKNRDRITL